MDSIPRSVTTKGTTVGPTWGLNITSKYLEHKVLDIISLVVTKFAHDKPNDGTNFFPHTSDIDDVTFIYKHKVINRIYNKSFKWYYLINTYDP